LNETYQNKKRESKKMKKIEYLSPEMETIELKYLKMLCASDEEPIHDGSGDPEIDIPD
jgi:signal recognition particle GTPase